MKQEISCGLRGNTQFRFKPIMDSYIHNFIFMQDDIPLFIVGAQSRVFEPLEERMEVHMIANKLILKKKRSK